MIGRNIIIKGMTGGAGHVGMTTRGYGGEFAPILLISVYLTSDAVIAKLTGIEIVVGVTLAEVTAGLTSDEAEVELTSDEVVIRLLTG